MLMNPTANFSASRRRFLSTAATSSIGLFQHASVWSSDTLSRDHQPYAEVTWDHCRHVGSVSHAHCRSQKSLDLLCRRGLTHLAISNYYPSAPCTPTERIGQFKVGQDFGTVANEGYVRREFAWNDIIRDPENGWFDKLSQKRQDSMPFEVGGPCFTQIPSDVILCPNAEHHSMTDSNGHFNAVGSQFASGTFDVRGYYFLNRHGYAMGTGLPWREAFERMIDALQFQTGGGITINHPTWSGMSAVKIAEFLDFDPRVLGIEIWNHTADFLNGKGWSLAEWDAVLATGRRCYGFAVSDHAANSDPAFQGRNVLLIDDATPPNEMPAACLRAYRNGNFYSSLDGTLQLKQFQFTGSKLTVELSAPSKLRVISANGVIHEQTGNSLSWTLPEGKALSAQHVFLRVEADAIDGEDRMFTQAIQLT
ncbi:hypothetical protein Pla52o_46640 [Novipirellula galeiformis]|uniref:Uncharacterized protein n=1 Tax=Novipirellula galeiformis TaxID=2528004 RepID=A0A5C6C6A2_9BACT|nr:hypothetical protein [Novipirellula galeiformis]TWU20150.1 hypothetical protein Pla52o_46640 [Novipirellula galeiformis]